MNTLAEYHSIYRRHSAHKQAQVKQAQVKQASSVDVPFSTVRQVNMFAEDQFNREECYQRVKSMLEDGTLASDDTIFYRGDDGLPMSTPEHPVVSLNGCYEMCGMSFGWYKDISSRLSTWLIPVFLLLSNIEASPLDKRGYLMIVHLLGDPRRAE